MLLVALALNGGSQSAHDTAGLKSLVKKLAKCCFIDIAGIQSDIKLGTHFATGAPRVIVNLAFFCDVEAFPTFPPTVLTFPIRLGRS